MQTERKKEGEGEQREHAREPVLAAAKPHQPRALWGWRAGRGSVAPRSIWPPNRGGLACIACIAKTGLGNQTQPRSQAANRKRQPPRLQFSWLLSGY